ncbi:MAG: peptide chain release factor N(5)-glutamine methyltransferase [Rubripirellula sp.]
MSTSQQDPWTVLRLLEWTTDFFKRKGSESPRLDAEVLLAHARGCSRIELYTAFGEEPEEEQRVAFRELVRRRGEGSPVAQLVGYREFYSLRFRIDDSTLIPRPETEHLVIEALDVAKASTITDRPLQIADIGTGSGAIAVSVAKTLKNCEVTAVDQSTAALKIAEWNAEKHEVSDRVRFIESDLLASVESPELFDIICTNPPYVSDAEYEELSSTVRDFEPKTALVSGPSGTEVIERIFNEAPSRMQIGGRLIIELSPMIADACLKISQDSEHFGDERFIKDLDQHRRILSVKRV